MFLCSAGGRDAGAHHDRPSDKGRAVGGGVCCRQAALTRVSLAPSSTALIRTRTRIHMHALHSTPLHSTHSTPLRTYLQETALKTVAAHFLTPQFISECPDQVRQLITRIVQDNAVAAAPNAPNQILSVRLAFVCLFVCLSVCLFVWHCSGFLPPRPLLSSPNQRPDSLLCPCAAVLCFVACFPPLLSFCFSGAAARIITT